MGAGTVSDSVTCYGDTVPLTGMSHPTIIGGLVPNFMISLYAMFSWYAWEACPFLKKNGGVVALGREEVRKTDVEKGERVNCGKDVIYKRRINMKENMTW